jgi:hypothetical protein
LLVIDVKWEPCLILSRYKLRDFSSVERQKLVSSRMDFVKDFFGFCKKSFFKKITLRNLFVNSEMAYKSGIEVLT